MPSRAELGAEDADISGNPSAVARVRAFVVALLVGGALPLLMVLTWSPGGVRTRWAFELREYCIPVLAIEGVVVLIALLSGLLPWLRRLKVPRLVAACLAIWLATAWATAFLVARRTDVSIFLTSVWTGHLLFGTAMAFLVSSRKVSGRTVATAILAGFGVYSIGMAVFALQVDTSNGFNWLTGIPGIGNIRRVAAYASALAGLSLGLLAVRSERRLLPFAVACLAFFVIFWTGARGSVVAILAASLAAVILFRPMRSWRLPVYAIATAAAGLALALADPVPAGGNGPGHMLHDTGDDGRLQIWGASLHAVKASPVYGHGEGQTRQVLPKGPGALKFRAHPHNLLLQWLMAWGAIGAACLLVVTGWAGVKLARLATPATIPFLFALGAQLAHSMIDGALYDIAPVFVFAACLGTAGGMTMRSHPRPAPA